MEDNAMKIITLEEHVTTAAVQKAVPQDVPVPEFMKKIQTRLLDVGEGRLADMDESGITMQVLSLAVNGVDRLSSQDQRFLLHDANDEIAAAVSVHPDRFAAWASLGLSEPASAAAELERCVRQHGFVGALVDGTTNGKFLDAPEFEPLFATAEKLEVPIYLHPAPPPATVQDAYFSGLPGGTGAMLARAGWGWHVETGLHVLRLILSGLFDRHPKLKMIIGHMGENLPFSLVRADTVMNRVGHGLKRPLKDYFHEHFWITTSGYFSQAPFQCALQVVGADRILFSVDYPFSDNQTGRAFLDSLSVSPTDLGKIAYDNARALLRLAGASHG
jgi:predicted TIM-barrel fold metal-dependent hydrolase